jgi:hypothetical protein
MAAGDLTTLAAAKQWMGLTDSSQDQQIARLITVYSQAAVSYIGRELARRTTTEFADGPGGNTLVVRNYPIISISSLSIDDRQIPASSSFSAPGFRHSDTVIDLTGGLRFTRGTRNVAVTMVCGYPTIPAGAEQAVLLAIHAGISARDRDPNTNSESVPGVYSQSYSAPTFLPSGSRELLEPLRRRFP